MRITVIVLCLITLMLLTGCTESDPAVYYVNSSATSEGDGTSWENALTDLQDALDMAKKGDEIWVAAGIYIPSKKIGGKEERNKSYQLKNGVALYGGFSGTELIRDQRDWKVNETILSGDILGNDQGFNNNDENCFHVVTGNKTDASAILDGFIITGGNANADAWPDDGGGGMNNHECSPTISNCTFRGNASFADGGGMRNWGESKPEITNCVFTGNQSGQEGGGMMNGAESTPTIINCIFSGNSTGEDGGGIYNNENSNPLVVNCLFVDNKVKLTGGGMFNINSSSPVVINCTFTGNSAEKAGGGICNTRSNPTFTNCIIWGNHAPADSAIRNIESSPAITYTNITGGYAGTGNIGEDPIFLENQWQLTEGSPSIDAGDNSAVPDNIKNDLMDMPRIRNSTVDMGAFEYGK